MIRDATVADAAAVTQIYNHYIEHTVITFEETPVTPAEIERRISNVTGATYPWIVYQDEDDILGYAYAAPWHARSAYRHTVEVSVYLERNATGRGIGKRLYAELFVRLKQLDVHVAIGGIALPNPASVSLHESLGFEKAAHYREVGRKFEKWIDVGYWQRFLNDV